MSSEGRLRQAPAGTAAGRRDRGLLATALAAAESFLLEPAGHTEDPTGSSGGHAPPAPRAVVAVFGLARGCGASVVARALAAELGARDRDGAAAVSCPDAPSGIPLAFPAAGRLARALADVPRARTRAVGRLCLVEGADPLSLADAARGLAPLVLDGGSHAVGGVYASLADRVVLVAAPGVEPALADVAAACLRRVGAEPLVVLNRARDADCWEGRAVVRLPASRMGAQLALGGREACGELGRAVAGLADLCGPAA